MKTNDNATIMDRVKEGGTWRREKRRGNFKRGGGGQSQERHREEREQRGREATIYRERKCTGQICHYADLYLGSAFYQNTCVRRRGIAFLITYCAESLVTSYFW